MSQACGGPSNGPMIGTVVLGPRSPQSAGAASPALASISYFGGGPAHRRRGGSRGLPAALYAGAERNRFVAVLAEGGSDRAVGQRLGECRYRGSATAERWLRKSRRRSVGETFELLWAAESAAVSALEQRNLRR